jgi:hypothetical protein
MVASGATHRIGDPWGRTLAQTLFFARPFARKRPSQQDSKSLPLNLVVNVEHVLRAVRPLGAPHISNVRYIAIVEAKGNRYGVDSGQQLVES